MNVKYKHYCLQLSDSFYSPWIVNCESFNIFKNILEVIQSCKWKGKRVGQQKLTKFSTPAFIVKTRSEINVANYVLRATAPNMFYQ